MTSTPSTAGRAGLLAACLLAACCVAGRAWAQADAMFARTIPAYPDLSFPQTAGTLGAFSSMSNAIFKPEGDGPFPAVVLVHTCGGLQPHINDRARDLLAAGFVVLVLDAYGPRGHRVFCTPAGVGAPRVYKDAFDALAALEKVKEVDRSRIYLMGLSLGSFAAAAVSSPGVAQLVGSTRRFRASAGWYGSCAFDVGPFPRWELVRPDLDRPVLMLLARKDDETPIAPCFPRLDELKAQGKPVAWHVYEDATHGWDKSNPQRGYKYSKDVTEDAMRRTIEFFRAN